VDFESVDGMPVDLVFVLLAPEGGRRRSPAGPGPHRPAVAHALVVQALRSTRDPAAIYSILTVGDTSRAA
jgi:PTS system nitrogen regulatory IIA component